ncbi:MAG: YfhO family protein, partial [Chloroflexi bacterium]|nr:YfhO family protein [Chloroflexota bacterium]
AVGYNPKDLMQVLFPTLTEWAGLYVGIVPLLLALVAPLALRNRSREVAFWGGTALFGLLLSLGGHVVLYDVLYLLAPGFGIFRQQERGAVLWSLGVAVLAGLGAAALARPLADEARRRLRRFLGWLVQLDLFYAALLAALYYVTLVTLGLQFPARNDALDKGFIVLLCLSLGTVLLFARLRPAFAHLSICRFAFLALIVLDLFSINMRTLTGDLSPAEHLNPAPVLAYLRDAPTAGTRVTGDALPGNASCFYELEDVGGASPLKLQAFDDVVNTLPEGRLWDLLAVRYVATWRGDLARDGLHKVFKGDEADVYELTNPGPRAWIVHRVEVLPRADMRLARLAAPDFDIRAAAILEQAAPTDLPGATAPAGSTARVIEQAPGRLVIDVSAAAPGLLVLSENWSPGWQATVDDAPAPVLHADHTLRAVPVPAGDHRVTMWLDPASLKLGALISAASLAIAGVLLVVAVTMSRRSETVSP